MTSGAEEFPFGHVGTYQRLGTHPRTDQNWGIVRKVNADVKYFPSGKLSAWAENDMAWQEVASQMYFLPIDQAYLSGAMSLRQLGEAVRRTASKELLLRLDDVAYFLIQATKKLHKNGRGLGMVTGDNVICLPGKDNEILLLDHGFVYEGTFPKPLWIEQPPADSALWGQVIEKQQIAASRITEPDIGRDVRLLIRVFQGLLVDRWQKSIISGEKIRTDPNCRTRSLKLWKKLDEVYEASDKADAIHRLEEGIELHPLSQHFVHSEASKAGASGSRRFPKILGGLVCLAAVAIGSVLYVNRSPLFFPMAEPGKSQELGPGKNVPIEPIADSTALTTLREINDNMSLDDRVSKLESAATANWLPNEKDVGLEFDKQCLSFLQSWKSQFSDARMAFESQGAEWQMAFTKLTTLTDLFLKISNIAETRMSSATKGEASSCVNSIRDIGSYPGLSNTFRDLLSKLPQH